MEIHYIYLKLGPRVPGERVTYFKYEISVNQEPMYIYPAFLNTDDIAGNIVTLWETGYSPMPSEVTQIVIKITGNIASGCSIKVMGKVWGFGASKEQKIEPQYDKITSYTIKLPTYPDWFLPAIGASGLVILGLIYKSRGK